MITNILAISPEKPISWLVDFIINWSIFIFLFRWQINTNEIFMRYSRRLGFWAYRVEVDSSLVANIINRNKNGSLIMDRALAAKIRRLL